MSSGAFGFFLTRRILIIGGGRWSKVWVTTLITVVPWEQYEIIVLSKINFTAYQKWIISEGIEPLVTVTQDPDILKKNNIDCCVLVNSPTERFVWLEKLLAQRTVTIVEKPFCQNLTDLMSIESSLRHSYDIISAAFFCKFLPIEDQVSQVTNQRFSLQEIHVEWYDSEPEKRYGQLKEYDPNVPVYLDVVPHCLSILERFLPVKETHFTDLTVGCGGAKCSVQLKCRNVQILFTIGRMQKHRVRRLMCKGNTCLSIDFSNDLIITHNDGVMTRSQPMFEDGKGVMAKLASAFINNVDQKTIPETLSAQTQVHYLKILADVQVAYTVSRKEWFLNFMTRVNVNWRWIVYYLTERLLEERIITRLQADKYLNINKVTNNRNVILKRLKALSEKKRSVSVFPEIVLVIDRLANNHDYS